MTERCIWELRAKNVLAVDWKPIKDRLGEDKGRELDCIICSGGHLPTYSNVGW